MTAIPTIDGVTARTITTPRLATRVLFAGPNDGIPVLFLHGNHSSATWWEDTMVALPDRYRAIAPDLRGFGEADRGAKIDATRGLGDLKEAGKGRGADHEKRTLGHHRAGAGLPRLYDGI